MTTDTSSAVQATDLPPGDGADPDDDALDVGELEVPDERAGTPWGRPLPWVDPTGGPPRPVLESRTWMQDAACVGTDPEAFFTSTKYAKVAVRTCLGCPVAEQCLASALLYGDAHGLWGGSTPQQRRRWGRRLRAGDTLGVVVRDGLAEVRWATASRGIHPRPDRDAIPTGHVGGVA